MKSYSSKTLGVATECNSIASTSEWVWTYRYSPFGGREQKRLISSPKGDSCLSSNTWLYYLKGASGEDMAVYMGRQFSGSLDSNTGRNVYWYPTHYVVDGGNMLVKPDGTREFNIKDHLGSVRVTVSIKLNVVQYRHYDYKPFGENLNSEANTFFGHEAMERDMESSYMNYGARLYA